MMQSQLVEQMQQLLTPGFENPEGIKGTCQLCVTHEQESYLLVMEVTPFWVKPEEPYFERYPQFKHAKPIEVILRPGELLIQPAGWFHVVYCLDTPTFSVSHFYRH